MSLKARFNNGLSEELKIVFPNIIPSLRPQTITPKFEAINPYWVSGFVDGDGCFYISLTNNSTGVGLVFKITQHIRDTDLLKELVNYFDCGRYSLSSQKLVILLLLNLKIFTLKFCLFLINILYRDLNI